MSNTSDTDQSDQEQYGILVQTTSQYQVFDKSGGLPFAVVFGLSRRYNGNDRDDDPRPLILDIAGSAFDVPYALRAGLLRLCKHPGGEAIDMSGLDAEPSPSKYVTLNPVVSKTAFNRLDDYLTYRCPISAASHLAHILEPGVKYKLQLSGNDLGLRWWALGEASDLVENDKPRGPSDPRSLVKRKHAGNAQFLVTESVSMPPIVRISLRYLPTETKTHDSKPTPFLIETEITNTADRPVTFQTSGWQYFAVPAGPWNEAPDIDTWTTRIGDSNETDGRRSFMITNTATQEIVFGEPARRSFGCGAKHTPPRPTNVVTLGPSKGILIKNQYDFGDVVHGLPDGEYQIELKTLGAWWAWGGKAELLSSDADSVARELRYPPVVPLQLQSNDRVQFIVRDGSAVVAI